MSDLFRVTKGFRLIPAAAVGWAAAAFRERGDRVDEVVEVVENAPAADLSAVLDALARIEDTQIALVTLLAFVAALLILVLFSGGWGNG